MPIGPAWAARTAGVVAATTVLVASAGAGGYVVGEGTGEDLHAARAAGERQGERLGARRDYEDSYRRGRRIGYTRAYGQAYTRAYGRAFENAGLTRPEEVDVPRSGS